jgi:hypothetical protein
MTYRIYCGRQGCPGAYEQYALPIDHCPPARTRTTARTFARMRDTNSDTNSDHATRERRTESDR